MNFKFLAAAAVIVFGVSGNAQAGSVAVTYDFRLGNFVGGFFGSPGPFFVPVDGDLVTGSFTVTLDPSLFYTNETSGISLNSLTGGPSIGSTLSFYTFSL